ncbi:MAG TPA: amidohydrolase family protein, partial [Actinomycetota bacterium]|nr:amidohydrolase family protein [Actinomycetota bacterium]
MKTLYRANRVRTLTLLPEGEWVLVDERHVERVGSGDPPPADRTVDLPGTTIFPGFVDAHVHLSGTGMALHGLNLAGTASRDEALRLSREYAAKDLGPVMGQGFDETRWADPALPTRIDLDALSSEPVLLVRTDGYVSVGNTALLQAAEVEAMNGAERGSDGQPTGVLREEANARAQLWYFQSLPDRVIGEAQLAAGGVAGARGVTAVQEMA